jgi:hypothetical protein
MIVEFEPNKMLLSSPPQWWLYYKQENDQYFNKISITYDKLKLFLETYGYATDNILELKQFGIDTQNITHNTNLKYALAQTIAEHK